MKMQLCFRFSGATFWRGVPVGKQSYRMGGVGEEVFCWLTPQMTTTNQEIDFSNPSTWTVPPCFLRPKEEEQLGFECPPWDASSAGGGLAYCATPQCWSLLFTLKLPAYRDDRLELSFGFASQGIILV